VAVTSAVDPQGAAMTLDTPWVLMWLIATGIYAACKILSWATTPTTATAARQLGYLLAWPGMDAATFLNGTTTVAASVAEWTFALLKMAGGVAVIFAGLPMIPAESAVIRGWVGMSGIVFTLHFGLFHVLSCGWRTRGINAAPLMAWPVLARSLADFWGRRWNRAFRDLTHRYVFKPLVRACGPRGGLAVGFLASGLVHELAITVPAGGGYGGPTLFFLVQGAGLLAEKRWPDLRSRGFTLVILLLPARWLFPPVFLQRVVLPFLQFLGAS
jgi:hypothetical protein